MTPGDLLNQEDLHKLRHRPELYNISNQSLYDRYWVCVVPQAILIFVSWMLPLNDCELDAQRKATLGDGIMCWLPVGTFFELSSNAFYLGFLGWKSSLGSEM
jgi:hypothetical protein